MFLVCQWISLRWSLHRLLCLSCSESATLDLVAVLGRVEVLHHLLVLLWHEWLSHPENRNGFREQILKVDTDDWERWGSGMSAKLGGKCRHGKWEGQCTRMMPVLRLKLKTITIQTEPKMYFYKIPSQKYMKQEPIRKTGILLETECGGVWRQWKGLRQEEGKGLNR